MAAGRGRTAAKTQPKPTEKRTDLTENSENIPPETEEPKTKVIEETLAEETAGNVEVPPAEETAENVEAPPEEGTAENKAENQEGQESVEEIPEDKKAIVEQVIKQFEERFLDQKKLIAVIPILYRSHLYQPGEQIPASETTMVKAWIDAGSARWIKDLPDAVKAKLATAEPGALGQMIDGSMDIVGKPGRKFGRGI